MKIKAKYIQTMDFTFKDVYILNCNTAEDVMKICDAGKILAIENEKRIEYINSNYIMYYELE